MRKKSIFEVLFWVIVFTVVFSTINIVTAQEKQFSVMSGYKALEVAATYTHEETELVFGLSIVAVDSEMIEKRANNNDKGGRHIINSEYTPGAFGLIGAKFDDLSIIGKIGGAYIKQDINGKPEPQNIYMTFGIIFDLKVSNSTGLRVSYDGISGPLGGVGFNF